MASLADDPGSDPAPGPPPAVETGREGHWLWWWVGARRVEMFPTKRGWEACVQASDWGDVTLKPDGLFAGEEEARAWCVKMAAAFAADLEDEAEG